jgi:hypothetical protein
MTPAARAKREEFVRSFDNPAKVRRLAGVVWRLKLTPDEWLAKVRAGFKWCTACEEWHHISKFYEDAAQPDGLNCKCRESVLKRLEEKRRANA